MNRGGRPPSSGLSRFLVRVDRRLRLARALQFASWALLPAIATFVVLLLLRRSELAPIAAGVVAGAGLVGAIFAAGRRDVTRAASAADRRAGLLDLLKTTLEVESLQPGTPWRPFLARRAESAVAGVAPASVVPVRPPRLPLVVAALGLVAAVVVAVRPDSPHAGSLGAVSSGTGTMRSALDEAGEGLEATGQPEMAATEKPGADRVRVAPPGAELGTPVGEADSLEAASASDHGEPSERRGGNESERGDAARDPDAASAPAESSATLRDERRRQGGDDSRSAGRDGQGAERGEQGQDRGRAENGHDGAPGSPARREIADQVVAFDMPSPAAARKSKGEAGAAAGQAAANGGQQQGALGEARTEIAQSGAAGSGLGTTVQNSSTPPLGDATELAVTLEEVLLSARSGEHETERRSRPSRRAEDATPEAPAPGRPSGARDPEAERPALSLPYPLRARELVREYFAPALGPDSTPAGAPKEESPG